MWTIIYTMNNNTINELLELNIRFWKKWFKNFKNHIKLHKNNQMTDSIVIIFLPKRFGNSSLKIAILT